MTIKHRGGRRVSVGQLIMQVHGASAAGPFYGVLGNLSAQGCFILSYARLARNEVVDGRVLLPTERWLDFRGGVAHYTEGVGFGIRFLGLTDEERAMIELVVDYALNLSFN
ncbi:MAG: PilZ domain-containing protein, partial [Pyrinomonadaceae bacterium]